MISTKKNSKTFGPDSDLNNPVSLLELLKHYATAAPYGYVISDHGQKHNPIIFVNPAFENITGHKAKEVLGQSCTFLLGKGRDQKSIKQLQDAVKKGQQTKDVVCSYKKDGTLYYAELSMVPISGQTGKITYCVWTQRDITDQVKAEENMAKLIREKEGRFSAFMDHSSEAIWRIDFEPPISLEDPEAKQIKDIFNNGIFSEANDAGAKIYGLKKGRDVVGRPLNDFFEDSVEENVKAATDMVRSKFKMKNLISREKVLDGKHKIILNNLSPYIEDNKVFHIWGSGLYISDLFETQEQLRLSKNKLKAQKRKLKKKNVALRELIVQIEHEKRSLEKRIMTNVEEIVLPSLERARLNGVQDIYIEQIYNDLGKLTSTFGQKLSALKIKLTPRELEVCNYVKNGMSNKEIARLLYIAVHTVEKHRRMARNKLGLTNKGTNLRSFLLSL